MPFRYGGVLTRSWTSVPDCQRLVGTGCDERDGEMGRYDGKNVVVIGGSSGLGLATAQLLADDGARVMITGRTRETLEDAGRRLGGNAVAVRSDVGSLPEIDALADRVKAEFGTVDALLVNAGIGSYDPFDAVSEQTYDEVFTINTKGPFLHRAEAGAAAGRGQWRGADHVDRERLGLRRGQRLFGQQGGPALDGPYSRPGAAAPEDPGQRGQPRPDRHGQTGEGTAGGSRGTDEGRVHREQPDAAVRPPGRVCPGGGVHGLRRDGHDRGRTGGSPPSLPALTNRSA